ncbi:MAG TPA: translation initiation factor IF-2 N-terminal domain-containing protein, partial [Acidimicrobiales bacterium]|nr:translation initiation factor IF-2 N-terminal domain-containing protein [Acidimicrobiales bacterium]
MAARIRLYELARELGLSNKETLDLCVALGIGVKSHSSSIEDAQADRVRRKADREGLRRPVQPEEVPAPPAAAAAGPAGSPSRAAGDGRRLVTSGGADHADAGARPTAARSFEPPPAAGQPAAPPLSPAAAAPPP